MRPVPRRLFVALVALTLGCAAVAGLGAEPRVIELAIRGGALPATQRVIRVQQGEEVTLRWTTDALTAVHLHGYDLERRITPEAPATMTFRARATGRFSITVHGPAKGSETTLGYLEVHPR